jgi:glyoxylase-like metal-dependent hydrolase (beta-lactamase superfamily II)
MEHHMPVPQPIKDFGQTPYQLDRECELFFPGAGHTYDNIVVWLPKEQILFGGCFLKSVTSPDLGNVADASVPDWADSLGRARRQYPAARIVVPGHGTISGDPFAKTLALLDQRKPMATG